MILGKINVDFINNKAVLELENDQKRIVTLVLQNKLGQPRFEKNYELPNGTHYLEMPIRYLDPGVYYVWIHYEDKTLMNSFTIKGQYQGMSKYFFFMRKW